MVFSFQAMMTKLGRSLAVCLVSSVATVRAAIPLGDVGSGTPFQLVSVVFQQDVSGYAGVEEAQSDRCDADPECRSSGPHIVAPRILVDLNNVGDEYQGLLRFNDIFGNYSNQIPFEATIVSAILRLQSTAANAGGDPVHLHRMLLPWSQATWNLWTAFTNGVQPDGIEARTNMDAVILSKALTVPFAVELDVRDSVQAWANGEPNYGWVFLATGPDGYMFDRSFIPTGPQLKIAYVVGAPVLTITNEAGNTIIRWSYDPGWELVGSPGADGSFTPVAGNPSGSFVIPPVARTNPASFFRLHYRGAAQ